MSNLVQVTRQGFGSRSKNSVGGAIFGFLLVAISTVVLFWNEGRSVKRYKDLNEGAAKVISVASDRIDPANEGRLVHLTGEAKTSKPLSDDQFGMTATAIKLVRTVEMYQWVEQVETRTREQVGGSTETTRSYSYVKEWNSGVVDSSQFQDSNNHRNPAAMKYTSSTLVADDVTVGAFKLPRFLIGKISGGDPFPANSLDKAYPEVKASGKIHNGGFYFGADPMSPTIGDIRVNFTLTPTGTISLVAQQAQNSFVSYVAKTGGKLDLLDRGALSAEEMFVSAHEANKVLTWGLRVVGFFMMMGGFAMILKPLAVFASILPFLGRIVETGTSIIAFLLAGVLWTIVVAFAWIFYRPILGITLLVITIGCIILIVRRLRMKPDSTPTTPGVPPPLDTPPPLN